MLKDLKTRTHLKPGQKGTKRLAKIYGEALLCIRFRYDEVTRTRLKTVELIVEKSDWTPPPSRYAVENLVSLRIAASNMSLRTQAKSAGAKWNPEKQLWFVSYGKIAGTPLEKHIQVDDKDNCGIPKKHLYVYT